jgi:serine/threonine-protein kinase
MLAVSARLSSVEAEAVWARAAELQAHTGMMAPPAPLSAPADSSATAAPPLTRGYDVDVVMHAAAEAGIAPKYVERALAERRRATAVSQVEVKPGARMQRAPNPLLGAHTKIEFECVLDGELSIDAFEEIADIAQRSLGDLIAVNAVGRTLTMSTSAARPGRGGMVRTLHLTVAVRNGRTVVRAFEDITGVAGGMYGGMGAGLGVAIGSVTMAVLSKSAGGIVGLGALLGILAGALGGARYAFTTASAHKQAELRGLVEELARFAAAQLHRAARTLGSGAHPTSGDR